MSLLWMALAGAFGTLARYALNLGVQRLAGETFPFGTFVVNALGCAIFGLCWALVEERGWLRGGAGLAVFVGFLGAFTTFSTFAFDTTQLLREQRWAFALANLIGQNVVGLGCLFLGILVGRRF